MTDVANRKKMAYGARFKKDATSQHDKVASFCMPKNSCENGDEPF